MGQARDGDDRDAVLVGEARHLGDDRVAARARGDEDDVAGVHGMVCEEGRGEAGQPLEDGAPRSARVQHQALEEDGPHVHEPAGTVIQLLREHVGVPRSPKTWMAAPPASASAMSAAPASIRGHATLSSRAVSSTAARR